MHREKDTALLDEVLAIAQEHGVQPTHVAIAWLRNRAAHSSTSLIPILGPRTLAQLDDTLSALSLTLSEEQLARLDRVSAIDPGTPHRQIADTLARAQGGDSGRFVAPLPPRA
ncbi:putative aldo-keto reductase [compost metagenome]